VSKTSTPSIAASAATSPETWLCAPAPPLTAVLERLPLTTIPLASPEPRLAAPSPISSRFASIP
jgi:hypothetical protein